LFYVIVIVIVNVIVNVTTIITIIIVGADPEYVTVDIEDDNKGASSGIY